MTSIAVPVSGLGTRSTGLEAHVYSCLSLCENGCHVVPVFRRETTDGNDSRQPILDLICLVPRVFLGFGSVLGHKLTLSNGIRNQPQSKSSVALPPHDLGRTQASTNGPQPERIVLLPPARTSRERRITKRNLDRLHGVRRLDGIQPRSRARWGASLCVYPFAFPQREHGFIEFIWRVRDAASVAVSTSEHDYRSQQERQCGVGTSCSRGHSAGRNERGCREWRIDKCQGGDGG